MELVILIAVLAVVVFLAKFGMMYLRKIKTETGYNPIGFLNSLMIIGIFVFPIAGIAVAENYENIIGYFIALGAVACLVGLIVRNLVLKSPVKIILVTFFQVIAPALTLLGIIYKKSGGIMGNAVTQANNNSATIINRGTTRKAAPKSDYTDAQEAMARSYGFYNAEDALINGMDVRTMK